MAAERTPRIAVGEACRSFDLPLSCDAALPWFTPGGERRWVPGWSPEIVLGDADAPEPGDIFQTHAHDHRFVWTVLDADRAAHRIRYVRIAEGFQVGEVEVRCTPTPPTPPTPHAADPGTSRSRVEVRYRLAGLGDRGAAVVDAFFAPGAFEAFIDTWPREIHAALAREAR